MNFIQKRSVDNFKGGAGNWGNRISGYKLEKDNKKHHFQLVSPHSLGPARIHLMKGMPPTLCNMLYFDDGDPAAECAICAMPPSNPKFKRNTPMPVRLYLGYFPELYKKMVPGKQQGSEFEANPLCVVSIPAHKKGLFLKPFDDKLAEDGVDEFLETMWTLENTEDAGFITPSKLDNPKKKLGGQFDLERIKDLQKEWSTKTEAEVHSVLLAAFANCKWDHPDMVAAGYKNPYPDTVAAAGETGDEQEPVSVGDTL